MALFPVQSILPPELRVEESIRSHARGRIAFLVLLVAVPAGCYGLIERQARRLDALGDHGRVAEATVVGIAHQQGVAYTRYAYEVDGAVHTWSVGHEEAPYAVGTRFPVLYLPEDPGLTRPNTDPHAAIAEAAHNRAFGRKLAAGLFVVFAAALFGTDRKLRTLRQGRTELNDPRLYRERLLLTGAMLVPLLALVFGWHWVDAGRQGQSRWPVVLSVVLVLGVLGGTAFYALRQGRAHVAERIARLMRWVVPVAIGLAVVRAVAWIVGSR